MIGDQWLCPCGWWNFFMRRKCRNCGEAALADETVKPFAYAMMQSMPDVPETDHQSSKD